VECGYLGFESAPCSDSDKDIVQHMSTKVTHKELIHYIKNNDCCALCTTAQHGAYIVIVISLKLTLK